METIPDYAYSWRPFASREMLAIPASGTRGDGVMLVDPWTQRWVIARPEALELTRLSDGVTRFSQILRTLAANDSLRTPEGGFAALANELVDLGLLFNCPESHRSAGVPVYNASPIVGLHLEVTNACNMTCEHCYVSSGKKMANELSLEEIKRTVDMLPAFTGKRIAISGGEPAVRKDLPEILDFCAIERGHDVDVYTNGKKFPRALAEHIHRLNETTTRSVRIQLSLEGATRHTNDAVRGDGSWDAALASLEMWREVGLGPHVVLFVCLTRHNIGEAKDVVKLAEKYGLGMVVFSQWQKQGNAANTPWGSIAPSSDEWVELGEWVLEYRHPTLRVFGNFYGDVHNDPQTRFSLDAAMFPKHKYFYNSFPRVSPDGAVWADQLWVDRTWVLGNVRTDTLDECFRRPQFYGQLESFKERKLQDCEECGWFDLCEGGSPGHTFAEYDGDMNHRDLFCDARRYWFRKFATSKLKDVLGELRSVQFPSEPGPVAGPSQNGTKKTRLPVFVAAPAHLDREVQSHS